MSDWIDTHINTVLVEMLPTAVLETLAQALLSALIAMIIGLPVGLLLTVVGPSGLRPLRWLYRPLSWLVDLGRAIPFIVLMVWLLPVTRLLAHTTLGWYPSVVPLVVGTFPFFARLVQNALQTVPDGKIEAALMAGASRSRVAFGVLLREALPGLISAMTVTTVMMIGFSAITGTLGGGGLGKLVYNYGYSRFMPDVMLACVICFVLITVIIQTIGDFVARRVDHTR